MATQKTTENLLFGETVNNETVVGTPKPHKDTSAVEVQASGSIQTNLKPKKDATLDKSQLKRGFESPTSLIKTLNEKSRGEGSPMKKERRSEEEEKAVKSEKKKPIKVKKDVSSKNPNEDTLKKPRNAFLLFCENEKDNMKNEIMKKKIQAAKEAGKSAEKEKMPSASEITSKLSEIWNEHKETKSDKFVEYSELYSKNLKEYRTKKNDANVSENPGRMKELEFENHELKEELKKTIDEKNDLKTKMEQKSEALEKSNELVQKLLKENEELMSELMDERQNLMDCEETSDDMHESMVQRKLAIENSNVIEMCEDNSSLVLQKDSVVENVEQCKTECTKQLCSNVPVCNLNKPLFEVTTSLPNPTRIPQPSANDLVKPQADIETGNGSDKNGANMRDSKPYSSHEDQNGFLPTAISGEGNNMATSNLGDTVSDSFQKEQNGGHPSAISDKGNNVATIQDTKINMTDTVLDSSQKEPVDKKFMAQTGDIVLAKVGGMRSWPSKIKAISNGVFSVQFYGDLKTATCGIHDIKEMTDEELAHLKKAAKTKGKSTSLLKKAILQVETNPNVI